MIVMVMIVIISDDGDDGDGGDYVDGDDDGVHDDDWLQSIYQLYRRGKYGRESCWQANAEGTEMDDQRR